MVVSRQTLSDGTIELTLRVPWKTIVKEYEAVVESIAKSTELPGFRRGKAPKHLVKNKVNKEKAYEEVLKRIIPKIYNDALVEQKIRPVVTPHIELKEAQEDKEWVVVAQTCERPKLSLDDYKSALADLNMSKRSKIWLPGEKNTQNENKAQKPTLDEVIDALLNVIKIEIPKLLLENEVNRLLSDLIDQTKKLGLSVEQYLASTGKTSETLRQEYENQAKKNISLELALEEIADIEGIILSDDDIDKVISSAKNEDERKSLASKRYYVASVLRRQKTIDWLASL